MQNNRLPDCPWQHLVFTLPDTLWPLFFYNRWLLDALFRLAADNLIYAAKRRGLRVGIFGALHTYGRRLNWHPHVHLSVTAGGLDEQGVWKICRSTKRPCGGAGCGWCAITCWDSRFRN